MSKLATQRMFDSVCVFQCPMCAKRGHQAQFAVRGSAFVCTCSTCPKQHTYNVSSHGIINMVPAQKSLQGYTREFFEARRKVIEQGWYSTLIDTVSDQVIALAHKAQQHSTEYQTAESQFSESQSAQLQSMDSQTLESQSAKFQFVDENQLCSSPKSSISPKSSTPFRVLDVGCGEGSYAKAIAEKAAHESVAHTQDSSLNIEVYAMDLAKDALSIATFGGGGNVRWVVADLAAMPWLDHTFDCIINMYSPANYAEFARIAKPNGTVIKVVPGPDHMTEVHAAVDSQQWKSASSAEENSNHVSNHNTDQTSTHTPSERTATQLFESQLTAVSSTRITQKVPVTDDNRGTVARMTPVLFHRDNRVDILQHVHSATLDGIVLTGTISLP